MWVPSDIGALPPSGNSFFTSRDTPIFRYLTFQAHLFSYIFSPFVGIYFTIFTSIFPYLSFVLSVSKFSLAPCYIFCPKITSAFSSHSVPEEDFGSQSKNFKKLIIFTGGYRKYCQMPIL
jgi:hypothetical protein